MWFFDQTCYVIVANTWHWQSIDDSIVRTMPTTSAEYRQLLADYDLCLTGQVLLICNYLL